MIRPSTFFDVMLGKAYAVQQHAYAPYSGFIVGACLRAEDDSLHTGCNVENASYGLTVCAENIALGKLISTGRRRIVEVVVVGGDVRDHLVDRKRHIFSRNSSKSDVSQGADLLRGDNIMCPPCGRCRQVIREFAAPDVSIHLLDGQTVKTYTLADLLPVSFGPDHVRT